jgi:hypothetical protein
MAGTAGAKPHPTPASVPRDQNQYFPTPEPVDLLISSGGTGVYTRLKFGEPLDLFSRNH